MTGRLQRERLRREEERKRREAWLKAENERIEWQRSLFVALPQSDAAEALKAGMLGRAWALLDAGHCEECDAILEFLPEADAIGLLEEYFRE